MTDHFLKAQGIRPEIRSYFDGMVKGPMYLQEAEFGLSQIKPCLDRLADGARVLEVGSGPGILLSEITARYPDLSVEGIEPMSDGFAFFADFHTRMAADIDGLNLHLIGYEGFRPKAPYDLIFLVNVFEHLPSWQDFLSFVRASLAPNGVCVVLCPNYGFPYESHFRLPVIWNKAMTGKVFQNKIEDYEAQNDCDGLYKSLNFVTLSQVRRQVRQAGLTLDVDTSIIEEMVQRLDTDSQFRERQKLLALPATLLKRTGLLSVLFKSRLLQNFLPYMHLTFRREVT